MARPFANSKKPFKVEVWAMKLGLPIELLKTKHFQTKSGALQFVSPWNKKHVPPDKAGLYEEAFLKEPPIAVTKNTI